MTELQGNAIFIWHCWRMAACFGRSLGLVRSGFVVGIAAGQAIFLKQKISWIASVLSCERNSQTYPAEDLSAKMPWHRYIQTINETMDGILALLQSMPRSALLRLGIVTERAHAQAYCRS